jgi:hypothetical protein
MERKLESKLFLRNKEISSLPPLSKVKPAEWNPFYVAFSDQVGFAAQDQTVMVDFGFNSNVHFVRLQRIRYFCRCFDGGTGFATDNELFSSRLSIEALAGVIRVATKDFYMSGASAYTTMDYFGVGEHNLAISEFDVSQVVANASFQFLMNTVLGVAFAAQVSFRTVCLYGEYKL